MVIERILEAVVIVVAVRTAMVLLGVPWGDGVALRRDLRRRRTPVAALALTGVLAVGCVLGLCWPGALTTLSRHGSGFGGWQVFTAPFVQEGVVGGILNVVSALVVLALAEWAWGAAIAVLIWLVGAWVPVSSAAAAFGYHVSAANETAYSAGSSGATYFTAGTLCAALLITRAGRVRWLGLAAPVIGVVMWWTANDGHGVLLVEGAACGAALAGACFMLRHTRSRRLVCGPVATVGS